MSARTYIEISDEQAEKLKSVFIGRIQQKERDGGQWILLPSQYQKAVFELDVQHELKDSKGKPGGQRLCYLAKTFREQLRRELKEAWENRTAL